MKCLTTNRRNALYLGRMTFRDVTSIYVTSFDMSFREHTIIKSLLDTYRPTLGRLVDVGQKRVHSILISAKNDNNMVFKLRRKQTKQSQLYHVKGNHPARVIDGDGGNDDGPMFFVPSTKTSRNKKFRGIFKKKGKPVTHLPTIGESTYNSSDNDTSWDAVDDEIECVLFLDERSERSSSSRSSSSSRGYKKDYTESREPAETSRRPSNSSEDSSVYKLMINELANDFSLEANKVESSKSTSTHRSTVRVAVKNTEPEHQGTSPSDDIRETIEETDGSSKRVEFEEGHAARHARVSISYDDTEVSYDESQSHFSEYEDESDGYTTDNPSWSHHERRAVTIKKNSLRRCASMNDVPEKSSLVKSVEKMRKSRSEVMSRPRKPEEQNAQSQHTRDSSVFFDEATTYTDSERFLRETATGGTTVAGESVWTDGVSTYDDMTTFDDSEVYNWKNMNSFDSWMSIQNELKGGSQNDCFCGAAWLF